MKLSAFWVQGCLDALEKFAAIDRARMDFLVRQFGHLPADEFNLVLKKELAQSGTHTDPRRALGTETGSAMSTAPLAKPENFAYSRREAARWGPEEFWDRMRFRPPSAPAAGQIADPRAKTNPGK